MNLLSPFGTLYGRVMDVRNRLYDRGILKSYYLGARAISVGNLTIGGTGKTPLVALIANLLTDEGEKVCILTRGYGRKHPKRRVLVTDGDKLLVDAATGGDEPVELAMKLDGKAVIVADPDRVAAASWALQKFDVTAFILDDGFQHRRARRDLDIVCIDASNPCGNGRILPAGTLRESFKNISRADAIVLTRSDLVEATDSSEKSLRNRNSEAPIFKARTEIIGLISIEDFPAGVPDQQSVGRLFAFTGISNARNFLKTLAGFSYEVAGEISFRDHHFFTQQDVHVIEEKARETDAVALVTTAKDAVKLKGLQFELPCYVALARTVIDEPDAFRTLLSSSS